MELALIGVAFLCTVYTCVRVLAIILDYIRFDEELRELEAERAYVAHLCDRQHAFACTYEQYRNYFKQPPIKQVISVQAFREFYRESRARWKSGRVR